MKTQKQICFFSTSSANDDDLLPFSLFATAPTKVAASSSSLSLSLSLQRNPKEPISEYVQPRVRPYRLAAHLTSAFVIYCGLLWTGLSIVMPEPPSESLAWVRGVSKVQRLALPISFLVGITAVSGAFVAGNDALDHRILATTTLLSICGLWWATRKLDIHPAMKSLIGSTMGMAGLQVTLGISTLLSYVPVSLGSAHQAGALTLLTLMILLTHSVRKPSMNLLKTLGSVPRTQASIGS